VEIISAREVIREDIKFLAKESSCYCELKKHELRFDEG
jgi:hypothetical protein